MTNLEKTFAFGLPIVALVAAGIALFHVPPPPPPPTVPPQVVDLATQSGNCIATPQHPYVVLSENPSVYFNSSDGGAYWVEIFPSGTSNPVCVADPTHPTGGATVVQVPSPSHTIIGYSAAYQGNVATEQDLPYIICNGSGGTTKCSNGPGYDGIHIKPTP